MGLAKNVTFKSPWKFISRIYPAFIELVRAVAKGGNIIRFWEDIIRF